jgi:hypothetical protein
MYFDHIGHQQSQKESADEGGVSPRPQADVQPRDGSELLQTHQLLVEASARYPLDERKDFVHRWEIATVHPTQITY